MNNINIYKFIKDWVPPEASIAFADKNQYLDYQSGIHDIRIRPGQPIPSGSISERVFQQRSRIESLVNESVFGIPYYGIGYPIEEDNGFIGALTVILPPLYALNSKTPTYSFITGKHEEIWNPIPIDQIAYIESNQKKTWLYTKNGQYSTIQTLRVLEQRLPSSFLRIHRSYIVNISFIQQLYRDVSSNLLIKLKIPDSPELTVSQTYVQTVRRILEF
ncbi:LytTR family DNA-binding domain-containing protein [Niallia endozanthoxylica]|uniref:LytTR family transcriptional regulator n=1 Tax=Niallia endozanthoxylica TaxID=2036016 RepID=A0A5J5HX89_9BACI|nr:LytTR family DNA-binding domain-containing protein [Niallia endozanthoxylica]KAA9027611.1 LytTR family transcriptional regulator [Niallia endozanthoxylica]